MIRQINSTSWIAVANKDFDVLIAEKLSAKETLAADITCLEENVTSISEDFIWRHIYSLYWVHRSFFETPFFNRVKRMTDQNRPDYSAGRAESRSGDIPGSVEKMRTRGKNIPMKPEKLNIAVFGHKRMPSREGGIEVVVEELSVRMVESGHQVTCYNRRGHHICGKEYDHAELHVYRGVTLKTVPTVDCKGLAAVSSSFFGAVRSAFGRCDIVHIHAEGPAFFCWLPKLFGKRVICSVHGLDWARQKWRGSLGSLYIWLGEKMAVKYADEIIVLSRGTRQYFEDTYGRMTKYIPNGVNRPERLQGSLIREKYGLEKDSYILYLSRIVPEKGEHYLIEAFRHVKTGKKLVIAGGSSDTDRYMKELKKLAAGDERIIFTGFVQGRLLGELYSNAYLYTLPSDLEGMSLSLLEAMSYGNCCLVSDIPECTEVVEEKAPTFRKGDVEDLRKKLQMLCDDQATVDRYRAVSADFVCGKYSWDAVVEKTLELYYGEKHEDINGK